METGTCKKRKVGKSLLELETEWGFRHTKLEHEFEEKVEKRKERFRRKYNIGKVKKMEGTVGFKINTTEYCLLGPPKEEMEKQKIRMAKKLYKNLTDDAYTIYMGFEKDDTEAMISFSASLNIHIFLLDTPESWGYTFIAVRNQPLSDRFYNPIEELEIDREFTISDNDFRKAKLYPYSFLYSPQQLEMGEVPQRCKDQLLNF